MRKNFIGILILSLLVLGLNGIGYASLSDGLVAYYPFNGNANDESGNGNNGTVHGATLTADRFGNANRAYAFNGIDEYIEASQSQSLDSTTNKLSISVWIKSDHNFQYGSGGILWYGPLLNLTYALSIGTNYKLNFYTNWNSSPSDGVYISNPLSESTWYHVGFVFNSGQANAYINGSLTTSTIFDNVVLPLHAGRIFRIGDDYGFRSEIWSGVIDDIRIYNRALSASEIQTLYLEQSCYETGFVAGVAYCKANPASCGINVNGGDAVTLTSDLKMHLPNIEYNVPFIGIMSMWADLVYDPTKTDAAYFKVTGAGAN
jgi:hypothetical protein